MFALCQLRFIPDWKISFRLEKILHSWEYWAVTYMQMHFLNWFCPEYLCKVSQSMLWLNPRGKLRMGKEGLRWLKLVPVSTSAGAVVGKCLPPPQSPVSPPNWLIICLARSVSAQLSVNAWCHYNKLWLGRNNHCHHAFSVINSERVRVSASRMKFSTILKKKEEHHQWLMINSEWKAILKIWKCWKWNKLEFS